MLNREERWPPFMAWVVEARYVGGYTIWLRFDDGLEGEIDFRDDLAGRFFGPLKDVGLFKRFVIEGGTLVWPTGADICHSVLYATVLDRVPSTRPV